jgi:hypothetical protein
MMDNKIQTISVNPLSPQGQDQYQQTGNDNVMIPNYGTVNINVQQGWIPATPTGSFYIPSVINREYYNLFVVGIEEFDKHYFKIMRKRSLCEYMTDETKKRFDALTPEMIAEIKTLPSLLMAENKEYGKASEEQRVIYGFVSDVKIYEEDVKIYYCGYTKDIKQQRLNGLLEELGLKGTDVFNELNRTHWAIKRVDLIQELLEANIQIPVFNMQR